MNRISLLTMLLVAIAATTVGCIDDPYVTLDKGTNKIRARSVSIDASQCRRKDGTFTDCATANPFDLQRMKELQGVIGAPQVALTGDDVANAKTKFGDLSAHHVRYPVGYGCAASLQGIFDIANPTEDQIKDHNNYKLAALEDVISAVQASRVSGVWTAAYGLGDGAGTCTYANHGLSFRGKEAAEQQGLPITNPANYAKVVRHIAKWYDRELPAKNADTSACKAKPKDVHCVERPWDCCASLYNIEYGRDPDGAGGFSEKTKATWLDGYTQFASELRKEFPKPGNSVSLIAPSVVLNGSLSVQDTKGSTRSWLFDFIDHVVAKKLSITFLSFEVVAKSPVEAQAIVQAVHDYVVAKGMVSDDPKDPGAKLKDPNHVYKYPADFKPVQLFVTDLRLDPSSVPEPIRKDDARYSAYEGAFWAASKILWQGMVDYATVGRAVRFPTVDVKKADITKPEFKNDSLDSNLMWYDTSVGLKQGDLKPGAWHAFWFNDGFLGGGGGALDSTTDPIEATKDTVAVATKKSMLRVVHGPDALDGEEKPSEGLIIAATRENCVYPTSSKKVGEPRDCIEEFNSAGEKQSKFPAVTDGRKRAIRVMVANGDYEYSTKEVLEHQLRVQVNKLPKEVKTVGYRWARMDGNDKTYNGFVFPEQGVIDVHDGSFAISRAVAVPSVHYFEFLYCKMKSSTSTTCDAE